MYLLCRSTLTAMFFSSFGILRNGMAAAHLVFGLDSTHNQWSFSTNLMCIKMYAYSKYCEHI